MDPDLSTWQHQMVHSRVSRGPHNDAGAILGSRVVYLFHFDIIISKDFFAPKALGPGKKEKKEKKKPTPISFVQVFVIRNSLSQR